MPAGAREHVTAVVPDRGAGESLGVTERPGDRPGFDERVARAGDVTGAPERLGEPEQEIAAGGTGGGGQRQTALEVLRGLFVRELAQRLLARPFRVLDGFRAVAPRRTA